MRQCPALGLKRKMAEQEITEETENQRFAKDAPLTVRVNEKVLLSRRKLFSLRSLCCLWIPIPVFRLSRPRRRAAARAEGHACHETQAGCRRLGDRHGGDLHFECRGGIDRLPAGRAAEIDGAAENKALPGSGGVRVRPGRHVQIVRDKDDPVIGIRLEEKVAAIERGSLQAARELDGTEGRKLFIGQGIRPARAVVEVKAHRARAAETHGDGIEGAIHIGIVKERAEPASVLDDRRRVSRRIDIGAVEDLRRAPQGPEGGGENDENGGAHCGSMPAIREGRYPPLGG